MEPLDKLTFKMRKEGKKWVVLCEEFNVKTYGKTIKKAIKRLADSLDPYVKIKY